MSTSVRVCMARQDAQEAARLAFGFTGASAVGGPLVLFVALLKPHWMWGALAAWGVVLLLAARACSQADSALRRLAALERRLAREEWGSDA